MLRPHMACHVCGRCSTTGSEPHSQELTRTPKFQQLVSTTPHVSLGRQECANQAGASMHGTKGHGPTKPEGHA